MIAGNHDFAFEGGDGAKLLTNARYLQDSGARIFGLIFYGSPWQPRFHDWAFNLDRGHALASVWAKIPEHVDVLIVHGPPRGVLDRTLRGESVGCNDLRKRIAETTNPAKVVVFGHIHEAYGVRRIGDTLYVNASICDERYEAVNNCIVVDVPLSLHSPATIFAHGISNDLQ